MYICDDCGSVLSEDELHEERCYVSEYMGGCYETYSGCSCGGSVSEARKCELCGEYFKEEDLYSGWCEDCLNEEMTIENALECGKEESAKTEVSINGFLASIFTEEEIEKLLLQALEEHIDSSDANAVAMIEKAEDYLNEDKSWFADWLKDKLNGGKKQ